jgi:hypothetical protein
LGEGSPAGLVYHNAHVANGQDAATAAADATRNDASRHGQGCPRSPAARWTCPRSAIGRHGRRIWRAPTECRPGTWRSAAAAAAWVAPHGRAAHAAWYGAPYHKRRTHEGQEEGRGTRLSPRLDGWEQAKS